MDSGETCNASMSDGRESSLSSSNYSNSSFSGPLTAEQRQDKIKRFWERKKARKNNKYVRYECRKNLAEKRFRY